jgi:hypothetical protein
MTAGEITTFSMAGRTKSVEVEEDRISPTHFKLFDKNAFSNHGRNRVERAFWPGLNPQPVDCNESLWILDRQAV